MNNKELINMKLHDIISVDDNTRVLCVYGGWIYAIQSYAGYITSTFVPYEN